MNYFGQAVQEIMQNNYFKTNSENSEIQDFISNFWNFIMGKFSEKKYPDFLALIGHILRIGNAKELNEAILKSPY